MPVHDDLGKRMKQYETVPKACLVRRMPVMIRIDGKAFHTFTKGFKKPFDDILISSMQKTAKYLCENIQGCVLGYTQSDEITLVLVDYKKLTSSAWFDSEVQKMCSIAASMATMAFNRIFEKEISAYHMYSLGIEKFNIYLNVIGKAMFDARVFNLPKEEVTNNIYWRQLDATRNSIQMLGQAHFPHKELQNKSCNQIQDMLILEKSVNWNNLPTYKKRGTCVVKNKVVTKSDGVTETCHIRNLNEKEFGWIIDTDIPVFKGEGREYIERLVNI